MTKTGSIGKAAATVVIIAFVSMIAFKGCGSESYDVAAPVVNPSAPITIDSGNTSTFSSTVPVALHAEDPDGVAAYYLSESSTPPAPTDAGWTAITGAPGTYDVTVNHTFADPATYGIKTVYVWYKDTLNNVFGYGNDTIEYKQFFSGGGGC